MSSFPETPLRHIPLPRLVLSPDNARHTQADGTAQDEFEASIAAHGLLENLVVYPLATTDGDGARYGVVAGGRRLAALEALARVGVVAHDHPVPCHVIAAPAPRPGTESGEATTRAVSPAAEARTRAGVGIGLEDDLRSIRATLVKAHLAHDFEAAFDLLLFQLARALFSRRPTGGQALDISIRESSVRPGKRLHDDDFAAWSPGERLLDEDRDALALDWLRSEDDGAAFAALRALPRTDKQALFAAALARTLSGQLAFEPAARPELEATVARLDIDFAAHVRPTAALFWSLSAQGPHPGDRGAPRRRVSLVEEGTTQTVVGLIW